MISVYITCKDDAEAKLIATHLLEKKLIACANIFPIRSIYRWNGKVTEEAEVAMLCKAKKESFERIKEEARQLHSYEIPCIIALPWHGSDDEYKKWVEEETK
ncbi:divalent-cation tolerance protein CutA [Candidatus Woesearchaeota archaeon]|nr:divalent-cation tolerance protein CutA [Candidatus Woesearchaeota archaeon]